MKCCKYVIHHTLQISNGSNKLDCYITPRLNGLLQTNTPSYWSLW